MVDVERIDGGPRSAVVVGAGAFAQAPARSVVARGTTIRLVEVDDIRPCRRGVTVHPRNGAAVHAEVATGTWLSRPARITTGKQPGALRAFGPLR
ncbi:hypothetical protein [Saccharothrix xinjiangensis]|uniref:Uncharacterized protein n=1 Tax=Saccharothrix xinjiangensis TaxID=204798 RepID=A0ABV9Y4A0_9PSEU